MPFPSAARAGLVVSAWIAAVPLAGCASVIALDELHRASDAPADGGAGASSAPQGAGGAKAGAADAGGASAAPSDPSCGTHPGPAMTRVGTGPTAFCVDTTQVTLDQYLTFLASHPGSSFLPDVCPSQGPQGPGGATGGSGPVTGVDWCGASAYCAWAGKALCGRLGGGALDSADPSKSQWVAACQAGALAPGALGDWENGCDGTDPHDACTSRGAPCDAQSSRARTAAAPDLGIRCCAP